jgi:hypothetical protein
MLNTPPKNSTVKFLRLVKENNFQSAGGREFDPDETRAMLNERETKKADRFADEYYSRLDPERKKMLSERAKKAWETRRLRAESGEPKVYKVLPGLILALRKVASGAQAHVDYDFRQFAKAFVQENGLEKYDAANYEEIPF